MIPATFDLAGQGKFKGYDRPDLRWNGWRCPLFPLETVRQIAALTREWDAEYPDATELISVDQDGRVWNTYDGHRVEETPTETEHGPMYSIGSFGWCWDLIPSRDYTDPDWRVDALDAWVDDPHNPETIEEARKAISDWDRDLCIEYCAGNDVNGIYRDEIMIDEYGAPMTTEEARDAVREMLFQSVGVSLSAT